MKRAPHDIELRPAGQRVRVEVDGELVADTEDAIVLDERGLPPRCYIPAADVRAGALRPSDKRSYCRFKGVATYRTVVTAAGEHPDLVWCYERPLPGMEAIAGHLCFYDDRVELRLG